MKGTYKIRYDENGGYIKYCGHKYYINNLCLLKECIIDYNNGILVIKED